MIAEKLWINVKKVIPTVQFTSEALLGASPILSHLGEETGYIFFFNEKWRVKNRADAIGKSQTEERI